MDREQIINTLLKRQIVYGKKYTLQGLLLWMDEDKIYEPMKLIKYSVCVNCYENFEGKQELIPVPMEDFELEDIEKAVDRFIELENSQGPD